jgi:hypothetical protein
MWVVVLCFFLYVPGSDDRNQPRKLDIDYSALSLVVEMIRNDRNTSNAAIARDGTYELGRDRQ